MLILKIPQRWMTLLMNSGAIVMGFKTNNHVFRTCLNSVWWQADEATHGQMCAEQHWIVLPGQALIFCAMLKAGAGQEERLQGAARDLRSLHLLRIPISVCVVYELYQITGFVWYWWVEVSWVKKQTHVSPSFLASLLPPSFRSFIAL